MIPDLNDAQNPSTPFSGCLTISSFCRLSGLGRTKVYELIKAGDLHSRKCGRRTLITVDEARRWRDALPGIDPSGR